MVAVVGVGKTARVVLVGRPSTKFGLPVVPIAGNVAGNYPVSYVTRVCPAADASSVPVAGLRCGTLTVPEDRSKPHGRVVKLDVFIAPARGQASSDPVLDFGADTLTTSPARDHSEEIQLAQRGATGVLGSDPALTCPEY